MKTTLRILLLLTGLAFFSWFVIRAGPLEIWQTCLSLSWWAPLTLLPFAFVYAADTVGWQFAFSAQGGRRVSFWQLFRIRWCGEAVNNVVPSAYVGGEAIKVYLLSKRGVPAAEATASVVIGRSVQTLTQVVFLVLGAVAFLTLGDAQSSAYSGVGLAVLGGIIAVTVMFWLQSRGLFLSLLNALRTLGIRFEVLESKREKLTQIDDLIIRFYRSERLRFFLSGCGYMMGWLLDTLDILLVSWLLGMPVTWTQALAIEAFVGVAKIVGLAVPGALGVQETGIALICRLAGLPDALGLSYAIIRRGREVVYAGLGWLLLHLEEGLESVSGKIAPVNQNS